METNGRRLGWIAIAISVVALVVALSGRAQMRGMNGYNNFRQQQQYSAPFNGGQGNVGPQAGPQDGPQGNSGGPNGGRGQFNGRGQFDQNNGFAGPFQGGPRPFHGGPGFFWPFFLIGGLARLLFFALLIFLVVKVLRRRGGWRGPRGGGPNGPWNQGPQTPNGEQNNTQDPPYTNETRSL